MAGYWLKMRHDLEDAPEVRRIARAVGLDADAVLGKLFRVWSWFDRHSTAGTLEGIGPDDLDDRVAAPGFADAMVAVGWLFVVAEGLAIPNWERHNGETAKTRALTQTRVAKHRNAPTVTVAGEHVTREPLPEERRGESPPPPPREASPEDAGALRSAWRAAAKAGTVKPHRASTLPPAAHDRLAEPGWLEDARAALEHLPRCRYFRTPVFLEQFCAEGFVARVLGGAYDDLATPKPGTPAAGDARRPAAEAAAEWSRAAGDPEAARRRAEYLEAKARKAAAAPPPAPAGPDEHQARAAILAELAGHEAGLELATPEPVP